MGTLPGLSAPVESSDRRDRRSGGRCYPQCGFLDFWQFLAASELPEPRVVLDPNQKCRQIQLSRDVPAPFS